MLKITVENHEKPMTIYLAGKLAGPWVDELQRVWKSLRGQRPSENIRVDLSQVLFVDSEGKQLLASMLDEGTRFENPQLLTRYIVDELQSPRAH